MRTLAYDCARCEPLEVDSKCRQCLRWSGLPGQTWGERTAVTIGIKNSSDEHCQHIPIQPSEKS